MKVQGNLVISSDFIVFEKFVGRVSRKVSECTRDGKVLVDSFLITYISTILNFLIVLYLRQGSTFEKANYHRILNIFLGDFQIISVK